MKKCIISITFVLLTVLPLPLALLSGCEVRQSNNGVQTSMLDERDGGGPLPIIYVNERFERIIFGETVELTGRTDAEEAIITVNGQPVEVLPELPWKPREGAPNDFSANLSLEEGVNEVVITATSWRGAVTQRTLYITSDTTTPEYLRSRPIIRDVSFEMNETKTTNDPVLVTFHIETTESDDMRVTAGIQSEAAWGRNRIDVTDNGDGTFEFVIEPLMDLYFIPQTEHRSRTVQIIAENKWGNQDSFSRTISFLGFKSPNITVNEPALDFDRFRRVSLSVGETLTLDLNDVFISDESLEFEEIVSVIVDDLPDGTWGTSAIISRRDIEGNIWSFTGAEQKWFFIVLIARYETGLAAVEFAISVS